MPGRLRRALPALASLLEARGDPYMLVGALAVAVWGLPRATADIDFSIRTDSTGLEAIARAAATAGFVVDEPWRDANPLLRDQHVRLASGDIIVDLMRPRDAHDDAALARCRRVEFGGRSLPVAAPDDLILMKLKAGRPRDFEDALAILRAQRQALDETFLTDWARRLGIADELSWLLDAAGGSSAR